MDSCAEQAALCQALMDRMNAPGQFSAEIHVRVTQLSPGRCEGVLEVHPENLNVLGIVHGGCLATLADTLAGLCVAATGNHCVTASYSMNFLRPATGEKIYCEAKAEKLGRKINVIRAELTNDTGELVAVGDFTFCSTGPVEPKQLSGPGTVWSMK